MGLADVDTREMRFSVLIDSGNNYAVIDPETKTKFLGLNNKPHFSFLSRQVGEHNRIVKVHTKSASD